MVGDSVDCSGGLPEGDSGGDCNRLGHVGGTHGPNGLGTRSDGVGQVGVVIVGNVLNVVLILEGVDVVVDGGDGLDESGDIVDLLIIVVIGNLGSGCCGGDCTVDIEGSLVEAHRDVLSDVERGLSLQDDLVDSEVDAVLGLVVVWNVLPVVDECRGSGNSHVCAVDGLPVNGLGGDSLCEDDSSDTSVVGPGYKDDPVDGIAGNSGLI